MKGAPVIIKTAPWTRGQITRAIKWGPHKLAKEHIAFLREEFVDMIRKGHWTLLPAIMVDGELVLQLSPLGVVPQ